MKIISLFVVAVISATLTVNAQENCSHSLKVSAETIDKIFASLKDYSIRGNPAQGSSAGYTEWYAKICLEGTTKDPITYSSQNAEGVKFTFMENGREKAANKLFDQLGELLQKSKPGGWKESFQEFEVTGNVYYSLFDRETNKTKEIRLKLNESFGKYDVHLWFECFSK